MNSPAIPRPSALAEALDQLLHKSAGAEFPRALLALQCQLVNARLGVLLPIADGALGAPIAAFPGRDDDTQLAALAKAAAELWQRARESAVAPLGGDGVLHVAIQPLRHEGEVRAVAALAFDAPNPFVAALAQERLELTARLAWAFDRNAAAAFAPTRLRRLVDVIETVAAQDAHAEVGAAALALANEVQVRFGAQRVAVGFARGGSVKLEAVSHAESLSPQLGARRALEAVLQQAIDEDRDLAIDAAPSGDLEGRALLVMPLRQANTAIGAFALLCAPESRPAGADIEALRLVAELTGPRFGDRLEIEFAPLARLRRLFDRRVARAQREGRGWRVAAIPVGAALALGVALFPAVRRIEAPFVAQPALRRIVAAPFDGKIAASGARPGDLVEAGKTEIARLETQELELELAAQRARRATELQRADLARGEGDPSGEQRALLTAEQAAAEIRLLEYHIGQARLVAPVTGVLIAGDLRQRIGAPIERGAVVAEVAPLEEMRAELSVPEDEVLDVAIGQTGTLATAARPGTSQQFEVERIEPLAELRDGQNSFRVIAKLTGASAADAGLLPGMQGVAKIDAGRSPLIWQAVRRVVNAVRMWLWI